MDITLDIIKIKELLAKARDVLIVTHEHPTFDSMGSSLALTLGLQALGKKVTIACPDAMTVELSSFIGANKVVSELGNKNFVISLDYVDGSIEKVSYNIEGDKFNLVIEPRSGFEPFSAEKVHYTHASSSVDVIFTVDTIHLGGLKKLYESDKNLFASKPIVNIDRHPNNASFGQINLVDPTASSTSEIVARLLSDLGIELSIDIANNLLNALYGATNIFQLPTITATAFELAATCMKVGAKRFGQTPPSQELSIGEAIAPLSSQSNQSQKMQDTSLPNEPTRTAFQVGVNPSQSVSKQPISISQPKSQTHSGSSGQAPADWLKPKIFKSSSLI